ncbi:MAG: hypothetical protein WC685_13750 [Methylobacter sp.]|jgi:hypothetical protein
MFDYNALTAWAAVAASAVAVYAIWAESKRSRFALGIDIFLKLDANFGEDKMRTTRRAAAEALLRDEDKGDVDDVLDFFEMVGMLVRRGVLDDYMVWHNFFYWIHGYYLSNSDYIAESRSVDPTIWADLVKLYRRMVSIEKKERQCSDQQLQLTEDKLTEFLEEEMTV